MLTKRQKEILSTLLALERPILTKTLAEHFSVTSRTIKSDVKQIKSWLQKQNIHLLSQPNKGIWLEVENQTKKLTVYHNLLLEPVDNEPWEREGRIKRIIIILGLHPMKYITADFLANQLLVSKKTIYNDMKKVQAYLSGKNVVLQAVPRKGYVLTGSETTIRFLIEHILTSRLITDGTYNEKGYVYVAMELGALSEELEVTTSLVQEYLFTDPIYFIEPKPTLTKITTIFLRLIISVSRMIKGNALQVCAIMKENVSLSEFGVYTQQVTKTIFQAKQLQWSEHEFIYIYRSLFLLDQEENLPNLVKNIINFVSNKLAVPFYEDNNLYGNVLAHLSNKFTEANAILMEENPFMEDLKTKHKRLFTYVREACENYLTLARFGLPVEKLSSFVTLHFLVSWETNFTEIEPLKVLYVCASGRGVARVIKNRVEREIPEVKVVEYCGLDELENVVNKRAFDLIISVFPLNTSLPMVWVEPIPTAENIKAIKNKVKDLLGNKIAYVPLIKKKVTKDMVEKEDAESKSREVILTALELYQSFKQVFSGRIKRNLEDAFLMHVFLMVHRILFSKEYDYLINTENTEFDVTDEYRLIVDIFKQHKLDPSTDEMKALLYYVEKEEVSWVK